MPTEPIRRVVIVGGGTSGWMAAAALTRLLAASQVSVTLVESDDIGTIGVGEATIPAIQNFNTILGLDEADFMRKTGATFKLGIEFTDWGGLGESYIHPFGTYGLDRPEVKFHQMWLKLREHAADVGEISDYNLTLIAARMNRFGKAKAKGGLAASLRYAYHFDAALYARYLRAYSEARGALRIEGLVTEIRQDEKGFVTSLVLKDGRTLDGDLFLDCSGFRGLLIEQTLKAGYVDWTQWLPCDRAVAQPCEQAGPLLPYTRSMADAAGWRWRIPLQHRVGNGYVYSSAHLDDEAAAARLRETLDGRALAEPRFLRFKAGHRRTFWDKNVVAIGLAGGFIEPLESTSIHLVQAAVTRLMRLFPDRDVNPALRDEFNQASRLEYEQIRDFIILHYKATKRDDTPLWRQCRDMDVPDSLKHKMELFRDSGRIFRFKDDLFTEDSWMAVMLGQGITPVRHDPVADSIPANDMKTAILVLRSAVMKAAQALPGHADFIQSYCPADL
ncbi:Flavin-dependent tryptophan halogenase PrnA (plasmid) [Asticcacaulis sp. MM231]|uniref:tryptophan halogenase family protein n=1 Tax=Asticcacaulis sp. MM231 TaxID=3157666 RepID=UPI0032D59CF4